MKRMQTDDTRWGPPSDSHPFGVWLDDPEPMSEVPASRVQGHRDESVTTTVDGVVQGADGEHLWLRAHPAANDEAGYDVGVSHELPPSVDLTRLVGQEVRATRVCDARHGEPLGRTLTINGHDGRVWLIARSGKVEGVTHTVSAAEGAPGIHAALSQRPMGPLVIGTSELQRMVPVGRSALVRMPTGERFRALFLERLADGTASYVLADDALVAESLS